MVQHYTQNDLIRYIYKDLPVTEYFEIEDALENDTTLNNTYKALYASYKSLPKIQFYPSSSILKNILCYSRSISPKAHC